MTYTDTSLDDSYIHPQDGSTEGINDADADWLNAVFLGAGYLAPGGDVAPFGYDVTPDFVNETIDISGGVAYIQDEDGLSFRVPDDTILNRSAEWNQPFVVIVYLQQGVTVDLQSTSGTNYIWVSFTRDSQDDAFVRVSDSKSDEPSTPSVLIEEIDAVESKQSPKNRVAGYDLIERLSDTIVTEPDDPVPDVARRGDLWYPLVKLTPGAETWRYDVGSPVGSGIALGTFNMYFGGGDSLYALDKFDGSEVWEFIAGGGINSGIAEDSNQVYAGSANTNLYAVNKESGEEVWRFPAGGNFDSGIAVGDNNVYAGSADTNLYAVDKQTGEEVWSFAAGGNFDSGIVIDDNNVYAGSADTNLYALDKATGSEVWRFAGGGNFDSRIRYDENTVYAGSADTDLYAIEKDTGNEKWKFTKAGSNIDGDIAVTDTSVYAGSVGGTLYKVDKTDGSLIYSFESAGPIDNGIVLDSDNVYFGGGTIAYSLDRQTGDLLWDFDAGGVIESGFARSGENVFFGGGGTSGVMFAFIAQETNRYGAPRLSNGNEWLLQV